MDLVYACHVKNTNWKTLINFNLSKLIDYCNNIYIVYSVSDDMVNFNADIFKKQIIYKNITFIKTENIGYDFKKYKIGLLYRIQENINNLSKSVILMNDSFIFIRNIKDIINNIQKKINNNVKFIGLSRCDLPKQHYQSYFWVLNNSLITELCDLLTNYRLDDTKGSNHIIMECEVGISNIFINKYKSDFIYHTNLDNLLIDKLCVLLDKGYPVVKFQCLKRGKYDDKSGRTITDFESNIYKKLHTDLKHLTDEQLKSHFFGPGIKEGRKYKYNQDTFIPQRIKLALDNSGLPYTYFI